MIAPKPRLWMCPKCKKILLERQDSDCIDLGKMMSCSICPKCKSKTKLISSPLDFIKVMCGR